MAGIVHWQPPAAALQRAAELVASGDPALSQYGPDEGLPELRQALREKLERENGLTGVRHRSFLCGTPCTGHACSHATRCHHMHHHRPRGATRLPELISIHAFPRAAARCHGDHGRQPTAFILLAPASASTLWLQYDVMVTTGANQAFSNVVLALLDPADRVALYK